MGHTLKHHRFGTLQQGRIHRHQTVAPIGPITAAVAVCGGCQPAGRGAGLACLLGQIDRPRHRHVAHGVGVGLGEVGPR
jgi:hypothetical protein